jgi:hypothetical protein
MSQFGVPVLKNVRKYQSSQVSGWNTCGAEMVLALRQVLLAPLHHLDQVGALRIVARLRSCVDVVAGQLTRGVSILNFLTRTGVT